MNYNNFDQNNSTANILNNDCSPRAQYEREQFTDYMLQVKLSHYVQLVQEGLIPVAHTYNGVTGQLVVIHYGSVHPGELRNRMDQIEMGIE